MQTYQKKTVLLVECLEDRQVPAVTIPLDVSRDQFGDQVLALQRYHIAPEFYSYDGYLNYFTIFDTGSPFVSFGYYSTQQGITDGDLVPVKVPGGAVANAIGGPIAAEVGMPNQIDLQGIGNLQFRHIDEDGNILFPPQYEAIWTDDLVQQMIQPVVTPLADGDYRPEYELPTLAGTPFLAPSARYTDGRAALIDLQGVSIDFTIIQNEDRDGDGLPDYGDEPAWIIRLPDLDFVSPGSTLTSRADESPVYRIPLTLRGVNNLDEPGLDVTRAPVPVQEQVSLTFGSGLRQNVSMLLDTGSQLTTITRALALQLGLDLTQPEMTTTIIGAAGRVEDVPGFTLDSLSMPLADGDTLTFTNVPVFVIDVAGYDGILGTNVFGPASRMLYDPYRPEGAELSVAFFAERPSATPPPSESFAYTLQQAGLRAILDDPAGFPLPGANFQTGQVSGQVYHDLNRDNVMDASDRTMESVVIFADLNNNRVRDTNEPFTESGATGLFSLSGLSPNRRYTIRQEAYPEVINLTPAQSVRVRSGTSITDLVFRNVTPPPKVTSFQIGNGQVDRSSVRMLHIMLDQSVTLEPDAIALYRLGRVVPVDWTADTSFGGTIITITFPGNDVRGGSLADGSYELRLKAAKVTAADGQQLDANANGIAGDNGKWSFHRLFGDMNGDGRVNRLDSRLLVAALQSPQDPAYIGLDYDNNGVVDSADTTRFWFNYRYYHQVKVRHYRSGL
jgi:hypothetical protein